MYQLGLLNRLFFYQRFLWAYKMLNKMQSSHDCSVVCWCKQISMLIGQAIGFILCIWLTQNTSLITSVETGILKWRRLWLLFVPLICTLFNHLCVSFNCAHVIIFIISFLFSQINVKIWIWFIIVYILSWRQWF